MKNKSDIVHLFVSLPMQDVCSLRDVNTGMLVQQLKSRIELKVGLPGDLIHLFFMNDEMSPEKALYQYKVKHGCILRVRIHKTWLGLVTAAWNGDIYEVFNNGVKKLDFPTTKSSIDDVDIEMWNKLVVKRATIALFIATHRGYLSLVLELLRESAADVRGCSMFGRTCLHMAAYQGFVGCVSLLLSEGAFSDIVDIFGKTPLQLAAINKHIYCEKRIYLHQSSGGDHLNRQLYGQTESPSNKTRKKPVSDVIPEDGQLKNVMMYNDPDIHLNVDKKEVKEEDKTYNEPKLISLPSVMKHKNHQNNHHQRDMSVNHSILTIPMVNNTRNTKDNEATSNKLLSNKENTSNLPKSILGIETILRTAQDDLIGEYHNIEPIKITHLTVPRDSHMDQNGVEVNTVRFNEQDGCGQETSEQQEEVVSQSHVKKVLGFVLKSHDISHDEMTQQPSQPSSIPEQSPHVLESNDDDEEMWYTSISTDPQRQRRNTSSLSYADWLKRKQSERSGLKPQNNTDVIKKSSGRQLDEETFQKWLNDKKRTRRRRSSSVSERRPGNGSSFEEWLRQKRRQTNAIPDEVSENASSKPKPRCLGNGMTFSEWVSCKQKLKEDNEKLEVSINKRTRSSSGKTYKEWMKDKRKEEKKEYEHIENMAIEKLEREEFLEIQRRQNPRVKTFQEWLEEKRAQKIIDSVQLHNAPNKSVLLSDMKYGEDAELVYDMWLTTKHVEEMEMEEHKYEEMKGKWNRRQRERMQFRDGIFLKLNQRNTPKLETH